MNRQARLKRAFGPGKPFWISESLLLKLYRHQSLTRVWCPIVYVTDRSVVTVLMTKDFCLFAAAHGMQLSVMNSSLCATMRNTRVCSLLILILSLHCMNCNFLHIDVLNEYIYCKHSVLNMSWTYPPYWHYSWIPCENVISSQNSVTFYFVKKTHFLILAGSVFCQKMIKAVNWLHWL